VVNKKKTKRKDGKIQEQILSRAQKEH